VARLARPAAALALLLPLASPAPAALAASPRADLFAGYSYRKSGDQGLNGWDAALGASLSRWIGAEADVSGHYGRQSGTDLSRLSFMAGPRFVYRTGGLAVFAHYLAGGVRSRASIGVLGVDIAETSTDFGMAAGGGADVRVSERWALRAQGDYVVVRAQGATEKDPRVAVGLVFRLTRN